MSFWSRFRAPLAAVVVAGFFGTAVVAPFAMPSPADAETMAFQTRINQQFVPNESLEADLVYADVPVLKLPDPEEERLKKEAEEAAKAAEKAKASSSGAAPRYTGGGSPAEWMAAAGIPESDWGYVDYIASRESTWNPNATNASSGACGLIQALPCSKVPGNGYDPVDNLRWANGYAVGRYGSWAKAYDFWTSNHWW
ncbi:transglycosylase SLT domain-containing protein [Leucobacter insecticola]|uniref:Transglycosylase SLT domain-containing protein n=1 Tax=Leucobacter insecticola TaxID=2714934 RepID=A0A6G8FL18_9MICO|nr:transglycosylase SLT domain-containing protein [Leucobacter insecticola]QIM16772.1 transglycosylase SLT domain-containing protein [Leucobacter insecticola]